MADELEGKEPAIEEPEQTKSGSAALNKTTILIGVVTFVVFMVVFVMLGGNSTPPEETQTAEAVEDSTETKEEHAAYEDEDVSPDGWHEEYSDYPFKEGGDEEDSAMSEEDSIEHVEWYKAQKQEIDRELAKVRAESAQLQQLKMETKALLERRKQLEETNIANLAKLFETMDADEVANIMENIPNPKVGLILQKMKKQNASEVMAQLPAERAAKISMELIDLGGEF